MRALLAGLLAAVDERLAVANADGSGLTTLPQLTGSDVDPAWSPSGRSVAYKLGKNVYRVPARRGAKRRLLVRNAARPAYSPNGKLLLLQRELTQDLGTSLLLANANGTRPTALFAGGEEDIGSTYDSWLAAAWRPLP